MNVIYEKILLNLIRKCIMTLQLVNTSQILSRFATDHQFVIIGRKYEMNV